MTEKEVRELRDIIFESKSTDKNWEHVKSNWTTPDSIKWLQEWAEKIKNKSLTPTTN